MFEVFSRSGNLHGVLIQANKNQLIYAHDKVMLEAGEVQEIPMGISYELVSSDDAQQLIFESAPGMEDGVDTESVLSLLIHREESLLSDTSSEAQLLAIRSMKMALDALKAPFIAA
jgi:hypothetical protein